MGDIEFLCRELKIKKDILFSARKDVETKNKRWVAIWFFRVGGYSYPRIGMRLNLNHSSALHACKNITPTLKNIAEELYCRYVTEVLHQERPVILPSQSKTVTVRLPDYHRNITYLKEVGADSIKPIKKIRKWDL